MGKKNKKTIKKKMSLSKKGTVNKDVNVEENSMKRNRIIKKIVASHRPQMVDKYKKGLMEIDKEEDKYDKLFEQKLAEQYKQFRRLKEHHMLMRKFVKIAGVLIIIILVALLLLSFS